MDNFKKKIFIFFKLPLFLIFVSCEQELIQVVEVTSPYETVNDKLKKVVKPLGVSALREFYAFNNDNLIWINDSLIFNEKAGNLIETLNNAENYGLVSSSYLGAYDLNELSPISKDTLLSSVFIDFIYDLNCGVFPDKILTSPFPAAVRNKEELVARLAEMVDTSSIEEIIFSCSPRHSQYITLLTALKKYNLRTKLVADQVNVPSNKKDSLNYLSYAAKALVIHGFLDSENVSDSIIISRVKDFQFEHGLNSDGVVGTKTAKLLSKSPFSYFLSAALALDKWRKKDIWSQNRIDINIPGYKLRYFQNNELVRLHKVIIGNVKAQTIEILDSVEYLVVYPYWYVPRSIINHEMLPKARKDSTYFKRKGFEILKGRTLVDSDNIDYNSSFSYTVRQKGGSSNALGLVKFIFPNPSSIYLHDTPSKKLFNKEVRAFSHGCIRLQDPLDLAYVVLEDDQSKYNKEKVRKIIENKERTRLNLNNKLTIYIHYTLASVLDSSIVFHEDVYNKEKESLKVLKKMFQKEIPLQ
ncbi:MAG: L,D-transpeptidase family protein [Flavobacteriales bacterium]|nr:L,D-transpeptidase family protein [Flavobacteriales bacterium]